MSLVVVSAGESASSRSHALARRALELGGGGRLVDLTELSADGLLGRREDPDVEAAVADAAAASTLVLVSPVYRATVTAAMKGFLDRFPNGGLDGVAVVLAATAAAPQHYLSIDTAGRALVASLRGWTVPTVVYATGDIAEVDADLGRALGEAASLSA